MARRGLLRVLKSRNVAAMQARGSVIETARKRRGWKRSEFASRLGLSYQHIYGLERGFNVAAEETLQRIADALSLDIEDIVDREASAPQATSDDHAGATTASPATEADEVAEQVRDGDPEAVAS